MNASTELVPRMNMSAITGEAISTERPMSRAGARVSPASGGRAVANSDSVAEPAGAARMVAAAIDHFGSIDCVVNNAGILRDCIFHRMSYVDFKQVIDVHLVGSFNVSRAAAAHFRKQQSGSFVHLTSTSGLIGNFGQANYSTG